MISLNKIYVAVPLPDKKFLNNNSDLDMAFGRVFIKTYSNNNYGHDLGRHCLIRTALNLSSVSRPAFEFVCDLFNYHGVC